MSTQRQCHPYPLRLPGSIHLHLAASIALSLAAVAEVAAAAADFCDPAALCRGGAGGPGGPGAGGTDGDYGGCVPHRLGVCNGRCLSDELPIFVQKDL